MHELPHASARRRHRLPDAWSRRGLWQLRPLPLPSGARGHATAKTGANPREVRTRKKRPRLGLVFDMTEITVRRGEPIERALRRLRKKLDREHTLKDFRDRRRFEKPSARKRRKTKAARFAATLKARHADD